MARTGGCGWCEASKCTVRCPSKSHRASIDDKSLVNVKNKSHWACIDDKSLARNGNIMGAFVVVLVIRASHGLKKPLSLQ